MHNVCRSLTTSDRLFLSCSRYQHHETNRLFSKLIDGQDSIQVLRIWGRDRCKVHKDVLEALNFTWENHITGTRKKIQLLMNFRRDKRVIRDYINYSDMLCSLYQLSRKQRCPRSFFHTLLKDGEYERTRGKIIQLTCDVKFYIYCGGITCVAIRPL
jgi:hypothetical protein